MILQFSFLKGGNGVKRSISEEVEIKKHVSKHNSAQNYLRMTKLHMGWLELNA